MDEVSSQLREILARECPEVSWSTTRIDVTRGWGHICYIEIHIPQQSTRQRDLEDNIRSVVNARLHDTQPRHSVSVFWGI